MQDVNNRINFLGRIERKYMGTLNSNCAIFCKPKTAEKENTILKNYFQRLHCTV